MANPRSIERRAFLKYSSLGIAGGLLAGADSRPGAVAWRWPTAEGARSGTREAIGWGDDWEEIRARFPIDRSYIHMAGLFLASHPEPVADAIRELRAALDANPTGTVLSRWSTPRAVRSVIAEYLEADADEIGLTGSTTMGLGILYHGIRLDPGDEILHTTHDHSVTDRAIAAKAEHAGASVRRISLYDNDHPERATLEAVLDGLRRGISPETRIVGVTWVHSRNGVRLPIREMGQVIDEVNADRAEQDHALFVVDGVHGFGIEDVTARELGCDFFSAGTHKWMFGPRGTGMVWGNPRAHDRITPVIPDIGGGGGWGGRMSPGGFHAFEHRWALGEAFRFHMQIGKPRIRERIHELNLMLKEGLAELPHVRLYTPMRSDMASGLVCFDVDGMTSRQVVDRLLEDHRIIASTTPYSPSFARLTPGLLNDPDEVTACVRAVAELG